MGDWGKFVGRIVEDVVNDRASVADSGLKSIIKRKVKSKAVGVATHISVDAADCITKPARNALANKASDGTQRRR